jgi:hypothetical protein
MAFTPSDFKGAGYNGLRTGATAYDRHSTAFANAVWLGPRYLGAGDVTTFNLATLAVGMNHDVFNGIVESPALAFAQIRPREARGIRTIDQLAAATAAVVTPNCVQLAPGQAAVRELFVRTVMVPGQLEAAVRTQEALRQYAPTDDHAAELTTRIAANNQVIAARQDIQVGFVDNFGPRLRELFLPQ